MRWYLYNHREGETRIIKRFLLFPTEIKNEVRWLEIATIYQKYLRIGGWRDVKFIDQSDE